MFEGKGRILSFVSGRLRRADRGSGRSMPLGPLPGPVSRPEPRPVPCPVSRPVPCPVSRPVSRPPQSRDFLPRFPFAQPSRHARTPEDRGCRPCASRPCADRALPAAGPGQSPRPDHRRHRHRQDRHAAGDGRTLFGGRRAGLHGRRQRRPDRHLAGRRAQRPPDRTAAATAPGHAGVQGGARHLVGCVRREGPPAAGHGVRHGSAAAVAHARAE